MNILDVDLENARLTRTRAEMCWLYQSDKLTDVRWCFLSLGDEGLYVACMTGNPADDTNPFELLETFRPVTTAEMDLLNYMIELHRSAMTEENR